VKLNKLILQFVQNKNAQEQEKEEEKKEEGLAYQWQNTMQNQMTVQRGWEKRL
jgi:hypothetical protein